jgi:hypothetical protein
VIRGCGRPRSRSPDGDVACDPEIALDEAVAIAADRAEALVEDRSQARVAGLTIGEDPESA